MELGTIGAGAFAKRALNAGHTVKLAMTKAQIACGK